MAIPRNDTIFCSFDVVKRETFDVRYVVLFFQHSAKAVLKTRICYDQLIWVGSKSLLKTSHEIVHHNVLSKPNLESKTDFKLMVAQQSGKAKSKSVQMVLKKLKRTYFVAYL